MSAQRSWKRSEWWIGLALVVVGCAAIEAPAGNGGDGNGGGGNGGSAPDAGPGVETDAGTDPGTDAGTDAQVPPNMEDAAACVMAMTSCSDTSECCEGLLCGTTTLGKVCCGDTGAPCATAGGEDCCGALLCLDGICQLSPVHTVNVDYQVQQTGYWCGPTATHIALSARIAAPSQQTLANELPTTVNGTDWIGQVTKVMNNYLGSGTYKTVEMPNDPPSQQQRDQLWNDIVHSIDSGYAIVANIVAPPNNHPPGYPNDQTIYHYFTIIGYNSQTHEVYIADPASFQGNQLYWLSFDQMATLIPPKGYSALN